ncbi:hypothetical protein ABFT80_23645 [Mesorhizobium sp. SB112]|uniref:hypothetical protein n=1 Tax=Mesorhizobium sp. SB112 TaxID=3151853 RepID=UPI00326694E6
MACTLETKKRPTGELDGLAELDRGEVLNRSFGVTDPVERERGMVPRGPVAIEKPGVLLLKKAAVLQNDLGNVPGRR